MEYVRVVMCDLPVTVRGYTILSYDDTGEPWYTIVINSRMGEQMQCRTYDHEIRHINNKDFDSMVSATELEKERHAV